MNYPSPYTTLGSASSSKAGPTGSSTALNNGYGTVRKAGLPNPASTSRPTTDSVTYVPASLLSCQALLSVGSPSLSEMQRDSSAEAGGIS